MTAINGRAYPITEHLYDVVVVAPEAPACARWSAARKRG